MSNDIFRSIVFALCALPLLLGTVRAETAPCSVATVADYAAWGWESLVMQNGLITLAVVPEIGARVMQYDLDGHPSIYVNPAELGNIYTPSESSSWPNYGGYKTWPAPQDRWLVPSGGWPPPPNLDFGSYSYEIVASTPESCVVRVESPVETLTRWSCQGLKFERQMTIYRGSTRVTVEQTMVNEGSSEVNWSMWDITQAIVNHPDEEDYENFWVYFPIKADSKFGEKGYYIMGGRTTNPEWKSNIAPGISAVQYQAVGGKIGADSDGGWICYVDRRDGYAYAKKFAHFPDGDYPDDGCSIEVFTSTGLLYLEVEVLSPLVDLAPEESYTFVEDWYAARCDGPILEVNNAGVIKNSLSVEGEAGSVSLSGAYGVFYQGEVRVVFKDASDETIMTGNSYPASPSDQFLFEDSSTLPAGTKTIELQLYDSLGQFVGVLDSSGPLTTDVELPQEGTEEGRSNGSSVISQQAMLQNCPNPFVRGTQIQYVLPDKARVEVSIWSLLGQKVATLVRGEQKAGSHAVWWNGEDRSGNQVSSGVYLCELKRDDTTSARKIVLMR